MTGAASRYRAAAPKTMRAVPLDSMVALYHRPSCQTHVVASPVPEVLEALHPDPLTIDALFDRLGERFDLGDGDRDALAARVDELVAAGLVERL